MTHADHAYRCGRFLSPVLDVLCGRSYDGDDDIDRLIGLAAAVISVSVAALIFIWRKEIVFGLIALFS